MNASDLLVVGGGLVGLSIAREAARRGLTVTLVHEGRPGEASPVGAGMLAPSVERSGGAAQGFLTAARDAYAERVAELAERTGIAIPMTGGGILEIAADAQDAERRRADLPAGSTWLPSDAVARVDAAYAAPFGASWHPNDGAVDPVPLRSALWQAVRDEARIVVVEPAAAVRTRRGLALTNGREVSAGVTVLATGAWAATLTDLPRRVPVVPVRGQMLELPAAPSRVVAYGAGGYVVPRPDGRTYVGATMEHAGFDPSTTDDGAAHLRGVAARLVPALAGAPVVRHAAALRPMTPDGLPIIGPDPEDPSLWYAAGHGRNGILLALETGALVADTLSGGSPSHEIAPFSITRFT